MNAGFRCRACGAAAATPVLSLGCTPLANALLDERALNAPEDRYPLELAWCAACTLVQITETVPPERLFRDYAYFSSFSDTMVAHARELVAGVTRRQRLGKDHLAVEIASNDGYLLQHYRDAGVPVLGIEPATNIATAARERGVRTLNEFFDEALATKLRSGGTRADVVHANNVLAHVPDPGGFMRGIARLLSDDGVAVIEVPYVRDLVEQCEFDTIYHEHLAYFSLTALDRLFRGAGLTIVDVERLPIHGGSLRLVARNVENAPGREHVERLLAEESSLGVDRLPYYEAFAGRVEALRAQLRAVLAEMKSAGRRLAAYGAAAKGSTLLNYCGIGRETLDFVADRSPHKQGRFMPGVKLPVVAPERLLEAMPDAVLLLTWNFADEILRQQAEYRRRGGRFLVPVPEVRLV